MGNTENSLSESVCICGKGTMNVSYRTADKGKEGFEHLWDIQCSHCRELYKIEKRGHLIGIVKKADEIAWEKESKIIGKEKSKKLLHKPKFIKIIHEVDDAK